MNIIERIEEFINTETEQSWQTHGDELHGTGWGCSDTSGHGCGVWPDSGSSLGEAWGCGLGDGQGSSHLRGSCSDYLGPEAFIGYGIGTYDGTAVCEYRFVNGGIGEVESNFEEFFDDDDG